jgi:hypothetical protein
MSKTEILKSTVEAANVALRAKRAGRKPATKGALCRGLILEGKKSVAEIAKAAKTTENSVYWYRSELKSLGARVPA